MIDDLCYPPRLLIGVGSLLALTAQIHDQIVCAGAEVIRRETLQRHEKRERVKGTLAVILRPVCTELIDVATGRQHSHKLVICIL